MNRVAALLAAVVAATGLAACGDDGAEPGAPKRAILVLDFQPNAVHTGVYSALHRGYYEEEGVDLEVREPSASTDAPKLLQAERAQLAILDIHDLGLARERGLDVVGVAALVQRPLAAVIAADRDEVLRPRDLEGGEVGVTGLPSDDAVLDSVLEADGADPESVDRTTIGFNAVSALAAGKLDAATAFWNAEGVELKRLGIPTREFRVDEYGAPRYPELVLVATRAVLRENGGLIEDVLNGTERGYEALEADPGAALADLLAEAPALEEEAQRAQLETLRAGQAFGSPADLDRAALRAWALWDAEHGLLSEPPKVSEAFALDLP